MKNLVFGLIATFIFGASSCAQSSNPLSSDQFFNLIIEKSADVKGENVLYITYDFNVKDKTYTNYNFEVREPSFFVIELPTSSTDRKAYTVTCMKGTRTLWVEECDGKFSCGSMIYNCLEAGGCATICTNNKMAYLPQTKDFVLLNK
jgi:hypothetical protein